MSDMAEALCRAVRDHHTGAVEWKDDKKRRIFFFRDGVLLLAQSNLRSESPERVAERMPDVPAEGIGLAVAQTRVREAVLADSGEVQVHFGVVPPAVEPYDIVSLLLPAGDRLPELPTIAMPRTPASGAPILARLAVEPDVVRYLLELDGTRPVDEVLEFGPGDPQELARALAVGVALGAIETAVPMPVSAPRPPPRPEPKASAPADIADLIRGSLGDDVEAPRAAPQPRAVVESDDDGPSGGASATITFGKRPAAPVGPTPEELEIAAFFGPILARIRQATDHFGVLGTTWQDPVDTHRRAYFALVQKIHPDRLTDATPAVAAVASELWDKVRVAWEVLADDKAREQYIAKVIRGEKTEDEKAMDKVRAILDAEAEFKRGVTELNAGRLPAAHELFARATERVPEEVEFSAYAGYTAFRLAYGRDDLAAEEGARRVSAALAANEKLDNVWVLHGIIQRTKGEDAAARRAFVTALKLKPANPDAAREMKRLEREKEPPPEPAKPGLFSRFFGKK